MKIKEKKLKVKEACSNASNECPDKTKEAQERKERIEAVVAILEGVHYRTENDKTDVVVSLVKSALTVQEIEQIMAPGQKDYLAGQVYKKGIY